MGLNKITFNDSTVEAKNDADLYYALSAYQEAGILTGLGNSCKCSSGTSVVTIQSGTVLIYGRVLTIDQNTQVSIPVNSFDKGLVIISVSTNSDTAELTVKEASGNYPTLTTNNLMQGVGTYELALCAYSKNNSTVTIDNDYSIKKIDKPSLNDYVVNALKGKADLEDGVLKTSQIPNIPAEKLPNIPADKLPSTGLTVDIAKQLTYGYGSGPENVTAKWLVDNANEVATNKANTAKSEAISQAISQAASDATSKANQALEDAKDYTDTQIDSLENDVITLSIDCDHELEITGQTGHEYGKAIPDESNVVISEIHGNTSTLYNNLVKSVQANKSLGINGDIYNFNGSYISNFVPVVPGMTYSFYAYTYNFYKSSNGNDFISQPYYNSTDSFHNITIPTGAHYLAIATKRGANVQIARGQFTESTMPTYGVNSDDLLYNSKATILSTGKNLFNYEASGYTDGVDMQNNFVSNSQKSATLNPTIVMPSQTYYVKFEGATADSYQVGYYTKDDEEISYGDFYSNSFSFTTPSNCYYIRFGQYKNGTSKKPTKVMLAYGNSAVDWQPYEQEEASFPELAAGEIAYPQSNTIKRFLKQTSTFDGSSDEDWAIDKSNSGFDICYTSFTASYGTCDSNSLNTTAASNLFPLGIYGQLNTFYIAGDNWLRIFVTKGAYANVSEFKSYLQSNNLIVMYGGAPYIEEYNGPSGYKVWNGGLQAQITDDKHCPYKLIKKEYSISLKAQVEANATINSNQQEQLNVALKGLYLHNYVINNLTQDNQTTSFTISFSVINDNPSGESKDAWDKIFGYLNNKKTEPSVNKIVVPASGEIYVAALGYTSLVYGIGPIWIDDKISALTVYMKKTDKTIAEASIYPNNITLFNVYTFKLF